MLIFLLQCWPSRFPSCFPNLRLAHQLPDYSSKDVLRQKLFFAMMEGQGSFFLS